MNPEEALTKAPAQIRRAELEVYDAKARMDKSRFRLRLIEADVARDVANATGQDGKALHRNETAREAAARRALESNADAAALRRHIVEEEALVARIQAHVEFLRDCQRNARVLLMARSPLNILFEEALP